MDDSGAVDIWCDVLLPSRRATGVVRRWTQSNDEHQVVGAHFGDREEVDPEGERRESVFIIVLVAVCVFCGFGSVSL